jgi:pimeloyl-ACP methyl ester carboxylesterase
MQILVQGHSTYCYTGGRPFDPQKPTALFIHGVLHDHSVWILQTRYLAHHGWNVLALDLPGHGRSAGEPPASVEQAADFVAELMQAAGLAKAALIGHSWGSLIALEAAERLKDCVSHAALVGTAFPMRVSAELLEAAQNEPLKAIAMINQFSRSTLAPPPSVLGPGTWVDGASIALNKRILASNRQFNLLHRGFVACDRYDRGLAAIEELTCPLLFVLGQVDQMTPLKAAQGLIAHARARGQSVEVASVPVGHHEMAEAPEATLAALRGFLASRHQPSV